MADATPSTVAHFRFRPATDAPILDVPVSSPLFQFWQAAREWDSRMRNRNRWIGDEGLFRDVSELTRQRLNEWGIGEDTLLQMARAGIV